MTRCPAAAAAPWSCDSVLLSMLAPDGGSLLLSDKCGEALPCATPTFSAVGCCAILPQATCCEQSIAAAAVCQVVLRPRMLRLLLAAVAVGLAATTAGRRPPRRPSLLLLLLLLLLDDADACERAARCAVAPAAARCALLLVMSLFSAAALSCTGGESPDA